jgi:hypothetical protein
MISQALVVLTGNDRIKTKNILYLPLLDSQPQHTGSRQLIISMVVGL